MTPMELMSYAKLTGTLAEISWFISVLLFLKGIKENNFSAWKKCIGFLIIAAVCIIIAFGFMIVAKTTE